MKRLVALPALVLAAPALAHPGHVAGSGGHSHWLALAALAAAVAIAAVGIARIALRRRRAVPE
jgi:hypothetical protein